MIEGLHLLGWRYLYMTTRLEGDKNYFLSFNQGSNGAGNVGGKEIQLIQMVMIPDIYGRMFCAKTDLWKSYISICIYKLNVCI